jgi:hypothetical protein
MGTRTCPGRAGTVGSAAVLVLAVVAALLLVGGSPAAACDPPYIVDEVTGEVDEEAWEAGVEDCAEWVREMEGGTAHRDATILAVVGAAGVAGTVVWLRRRRRRRVSEGTRTAR